MAERKSSNIEVLISLALTPFILFALLYGVVYAGLWMIYIGLLVFLFAFWLWMLVDCLSGEREDKVVWVIVLIFLFLLGALLYFFIAYKKPKRDCQA